MANMSHCNTERMVARTSVNSPMTPESVTVSYGRSRTLQPLCGAVTVRLVSQIQSRHKISVASQWWTMSMPDQLLLLMAFPPTSGPNIETETATKIWLRSITTAMETLIHLSTKPSAAEGLPKGNGRYGKGTCNR
ncbi:uncharacterized protein Z520_09526 [Fonsecaea multimorphosa CBS 102226]|uniref:Uncharacterized protein n=1 Tax=Fonsecaea multimorphosa CBS 102226 TaxID=1442371 RepID=A0A0D2ICG3_9EURO|nr:uncharacterized protein Z520_09526 [Fonsecaea multimorphosa CBS 102226]KIX94836.1 hypothetical protein Z520_09526 [Fonsecaea multimorphosa CBS 102226]